MGYRRGTVGDIIGYVCDCEASYRSYSAWHLHNKRVHESEPQTTYSEPKQSGDIKEPVLDHGKAARNVMLFAVGCIVVFVFFSKNIMEFLGLDDNDESAQNWSPNVSSNGAIL